MSERDRWDETLDAARQYLKQMLPTLGSAPDKLQIEWRDNPPELPDDSDRAAQSEWVRRCTAAILDALITQGCVPAWNGDGVGCVMQIVYAFAKLDRDRKKNNG